MSADDASDIQARRVEIARGICEAKASDKPLDAQKLLDDLTWLLNVTEPPDQPDPRSVPRVWAGPTIGYKHWWWNWGQWNDSRLIGDLRPGDIFVPRMFPKPTDPPGPIHLLDQCSEADWLPATTT